MDKEEARFILRCFRPDGSDAANPDFKAALKLAAEDRELGEWLARERSQDAEFSAALGRLELPGTLREEILSGLAVERGDLPQADDIDGPMIAALVTVRPPEGLRSEILQAMKQSVGTGGLESKSGPQSESGPEPEPGKVVQGSSAWWKFGLPLAAAAGIALAIVMNRPETPGTPPSPIAAIPVSLVESSSMDTLQALKSKQIDLEFRAKDHAELFDYVRRPGSKCPAGHLPPGLREVDGIGCRVLEFDGKQGALICFNRDNGEVVHLVVFRRTDVDGELSVDPQQAIEQKGDWAVTHWQAGDRAFLALSQTDTESLSEIF